VAAIESVSVKKIVNNQRNGVWHENGEMASTIMASNGKMARQRHRS